MKVGMILEPGSQAEWEVWLSEHHASIPEVWLRLAKKGTNATTVTRPEALETALCYGWIDGQAKAEDETYWLQRFTPRTKRSKWSRINCEAVDRLMAEGRMKASGMAAVEAARADGRWDAAYEPPSTMEVPADLRERLDANPQADAFFKTLKSQNRYAILHRIQDAKKPETRARRIDKFVGMLERGETLY